MVVMAMAASTKSARAKGTWARRSLVFRSIFTLLLLLKGDDMHVKPGGLFDDSVGHRAAQEFPPPGLMGAADDNMAYPVGPGIVQERRHRVPGLEADDLCPQFPGLLNMLQKVALGFGIDLGGGLPWGFHIDHKPMGVEASGHAGAFPEERFRPGRGRGHADHNPAQGSWRGFAHHSRFIGPGGWPSSQALGNLQEHQF